MYSLGGEREDAGSFQRFPTNLLHCGSSYPKDHAVRTEKVPTAKYVIHNFRDQRNDHWVVFWMPWAL